MATDNPFAKLSKPAQRALASAGITSLKDLTFITQAELMELHGIGKHAITNITAQMEAAQLSFRINKT